MSLEPTTGRVPLGVALFALVIVASVVTTAAVARNGGARSTSPPAPGRVWRPPISPAHASRLLVGLPTVSLARGVAYDRTADFGPAWADVDHDGCDTRNGILRRDLGRLSTRPGTGGCVIVGGVLHDPYTGADMAFSKARADEIQIDHLVPLHAAWMLGAFRWTAAQRLAYANDPAVLLAVSGQANQDKGDLLPDRWRPPSRRSWCAYGAAIVNVHARYGLGVTRGERAALTAMLARCG